MSADFRRGQLYWAQVPYLPERPLDILHREPQRGEQRIALLSKHKNLIMEQIGTLPDKRMAELNVRLALSLGLIEAQK